MRVLHLMDAAGPQACGTTLALLAASGRRLGHTQVKTLLLGGATLARAAQDAGIDNAEAVGVPYGRAYLGYPAVHRRVRAMCNSDEAFDLIHCWSVGALSLATLLFRHVPRVLTLTTVPRHRTVHWLRVMTHDSGAGQAGRTALLPISATIHRALLGGGVSESAAHVLRPGIDLSLVAHSARAALRQGWGVESDRVRVVAVLRDPPQAGDAIEAAIAVGLADEVYAAHGDDAKARLRLLMHPDQQHRRRAEQLMRHIGRHERIIREPRLDRPWEVLSGCDMAIAQGEHAGGLSLLWAMAANVPIVGEATYAISEIVEDRHSALLAKPGQPKALSHRLCQLTAEPPLAWKLHDTARHEAYSLFSPQRYRTSLQTVYDQMVAGQSVEVPPLESTGGLRFAGRG